MNFIENLGEIDELALDPREKWHAQNVGNQLIHSTTYYPFNIANQIGPTIEHAVARLNGMQLDEMWSQDTKEFIGCACLVYLGTYLLKISVVMMIQVESSALICISPVINPTFSVPNLRLKSRNFWLLRAYRKYIGRVRQQFGTSIKPQSRSQIHLPWWVKYRYNVWLVALPAPRHTPPPPLKKRNKIDPGIVSRLCRQATDTYSAT